MAAGRNGQNEPYLYLPVAGSRLPVSSVREGSVGLKRILRTKVKVVAAQSVSIRELQRVCQAVHWAGRTSSNLHHFFQAAAVFKARQIFQFSNLNVVQMI